MCGGGTPVSVTIFFLPEQETFFSLKHALTLIRND
jgi:hypothetical protein